MKSIKLKIATWLIILMGIGGSSIAKDTTLLPKFNLDSAIEVYMDSNRQEVLITTEPLDILIESEPVENNEALQEMLELQLEETDSFNQNFKSLNKIIRDLPYVNVEAKLDLLDHYNIDPVQINKDYRLFWGLSWCTLGILLCIYFWFNFTSTYLYWSKKLRWNTFMNLTIAIIALGYIIPKLLCLVFIDNFYLWQNIDKLF